MTTIEKINTSISRHLQEKVDFFLENKKIKSGKLILFCIKDFYCTFTLVIEEKKKKITFEVPYPFNVTTQTDQLTFDYSLQTFINNNNLIKEDINIIKNKKTSKLFNKKLVLKFYI